MAQPSPLLPVQEDQRQQVGIKASFEENGCKNPSPSLYKIQLSDCSHLPDSNHHFLPLPCTSTRSIPDRKGIFPSLIYFLLIRPSQRNWSLTFISLVLGKQSVLIKLTNRAILWPGTADQYNVFSDTVEMKTYCDPKHIQSDIYSPPKER